MLNTLYPPFASAPPTVDVTQDELKAQRDAFFKYISAVDKNGPQVLSKIIRHGMAEGDKNGWAPIVRTLQMYLQITNSMINECCSIRDLEDLEPLRSSKGGNSKIDSGILVPGSNMRPATASSTSVDMPSRPKTPSGGRGTALEKLARGLKTIGRSRTDVSEIGPKEEMFTTSPPKQQQQHKALRKMRSMGDRSLKSAQGKDSPAFDVDEMRRLRMAYEQRLASGGSFEV